MGVAQPLPCLSGGGLHPAGPVLHRPQLPARLPQDDPTAGGDSPLQLTFTSSLKQFQRLRAK